MNPFHRTLTLVAVLGLALLQGGCDDPDRPGSAEPAAFSGSLVLTGSSTVAPLAGEIARRFDDTALLWWMDGAGTLVEKSPTPEFFDQPASPLTRDYVSGVRG